MLRILALADIHSSNDAAQKVAKAAIKADVIVVAGDITHFGSIKELTDILSTISNSKPLLFVPGNCDPPSSIGIKRIGDRIINIHCLEYRLNGYIFVGAGGSLRTPFNTMIEFSEDYYRQCIEDISIDVPERTIIVTHNPPYGILDKVYLGEHVGSRVFRQLIIEKQPLLWITAHVHEQKGFKKVNATTIVNPGALKNGNYALLMVKEGAVEVVLGRIS